MRTDDFATESPYVTVAGLPKHKLDLRKVWQEIDHRVLVLSMAVNEPELNGPPTGVHRPLLRELISQFPK
jgi:hypothetical protein